MATTYTLISSNVLSSSAASVTFSSIPATYTDLVIRLSTRSTTASNISGIDITLNGNVTSIYSYTKLQGNGATASSTNSSAGAPLTVNWINGATSTSNTFSKSVLYFPNYTGTVAKPISWSNAQENNITTAYLNATATLANLTSAITTILLADNGGGSFASGSSFYLYGISSN